jgi:hypothetical protein
MTLYGIAGGEAQISGHDQIYGPLKFTRETVWPGGLQVALVENIPIAYFNVQGLTRIRGGFRIRRPGSVLNTMPNVYFQLTLYTRRTDAAGCLNIFDLAYGPLIPEPAGLRCKLSIGGSRETLSARSTAILLPQLADRRWNEAELSLRLRGSATIRRVVAICRLSPNCELWQPTAGLNGASQEAHNRLMNFDFRATSCEMLALTNWPTTITWLVEFLPDADIHGIESALDELIAYSLPRRLGPGDMGGGGGIGSIATGGENGRTVADPMRWMSPPQRYGLIYDRFPVLMEVMIGSPEACRAVAKAIGEEARATEITNDLGERIAAVHVPYRFVFDRAAQAACREWTVTSSNEELDRLRENRRREGLC